MKNAGWLLSLALLAHVLACAGGQSRPTASSTKRPIAPAGLDAALVQHYPKWAHDAGVEGSALVRFQIDKRGKVTPTHVVEATHPSFGEACMTLLGTDLRWVPARNAQGKPINGIYAFRCHFQFTADNARSGHAGPQR